MPPYQKALADILDRQRGSAVFWLLFFSLAPLFQPDFLNSIPFLTAAALALAACAVSEFCAWRYWNRPAEAPARLGSIFVAVAATRNTGLGVTLGYAYWKHGITELDLLGTAVLMAFALGAIMVTRPNWLVLSVALCGLFLPAIIGALLAGTQLGFAVAICLSAGFVYFFRQARMDHIHYWRALHDARTLRLAQERAAQNAKREAVLLASQSRQNAITAERSRIAAEWHDSLLASLSAATLQIEANQRRIERSKGDNDGLNLALETLRRCRAEARLAISDLLSVSQEKQDLPLALRAALDPLAAGSQVELVLSTHGDPGRFAASFDSREVLRICQEAVANSIRHGAAARIELVLNYSADHLCLTLSDNGSGFDPSRVGPGHFGITIMRQRADRLSARFSLESQPGQGTTIKLVIPYRGCTMKPIRVLIVEDHYLARLALQTLLGAEPNIEVVGEAGNVARALELLAETQPDVTVLDLRLPDGSGIQVLKEIRAREQAAKVLVVSNLDGSENIAGALAEGALGYVLKDSSASELLAAIETVSQGTQYLSPAVSQILDQRSYCDELTPRELDVLELLVRGLSNKGIGDSLGISEKTVRAHMTGVLSKLHAEDRTQAALIAVRRGFVEPIAPPK